MTTRIPLDDATVPSRSQPAQTQTIDTPIDPADRTAGWTPRSERLAPRRSRLPGLMVAALLRGRNHGRRRVQPERRAQPGYTHRRQRGNSTRLFADRCAERYRRGGYGAVGSATADTVRAANRMAEEVDDAAISAKVRTALAADPALSASKIGVTTREGVVELKGSAPDQRSRERAQVLAVAPEGVVRVDNRSVVPPPVNSVPQA